MKTVITTILLTLCLNSGHAQCQRAGRDTSDVFYCKNTPFDLADLLSDDASTGGVFIDPAGDTMASSILSLAFPGQYHFQYKVTGTGCLVDSAQLVVTIVTCGTGGLTEYGTENNALMYPNPVTDLITLNADQADRLIIYAVDGSPVLILAAPLSKQVDLSHLVRGTYVLVVEKNTQRQFRRFIKN